MNVQDAEFLSKCQGVVQLGHMVGLFLDFLRSLLTDFQHGCASLYFHQEWVKVHPLPTYHHPHPLSLILWMMAILTGVTENL